MRISQEKSGCCSARVIRFGGKRRQCVSCKKTWSIYPAKRGRKTLRKQWKYLGKVFLQHFFVKQLAVHSRLSVNALYKRFQSNLTDLIKEKRIIKVSGRKLILIVDAEWQCFKGNLWTMYFVAVKSSDSNTVTLFDPMLQFGKESATGWNNVINKLPLSVKNRVCALVSDGITGIEMVAANNAWII